MASWKGNARTVSYSASKAALWSLTDALREGLRDQGTLVVGVHAGYVDTDGSAWLDVPKIGPAEVAAKTMQALLDDRVEVLVDEAARRLKAALSQPLDRESLTCPAE
ncbi:SDR family NAD(P)-dependent oxidoreductase [Amycolatopsis sp. NPDC051372]|uniref:SDR family NAD(P)-dependent oxidoreductase n=1 Tax=Amycolatopsis sp. NPDC051372 TaxID=3155669 RepID=UPI003427E885